MDKYLRCECCGNYFVKTQKKQLLCSKECEDNYLRCIICGHYYILESFLDQENLICSKECSAKYNYKKKKDRTKVDLNQLR